VVAHGPRQGGAEVEATLDAHVVGILVAAFSVAGILAWLLVKLIRQALKDSRFYQEAVLAVQSSPEACEVLGTPMEFGLPTGNIFVHLLGGRASLRIPVTGQKDKGVVLVRARKRWLSWLYNRVQVDVGSQSIDLTARMKSE
jgi:hypothetical protein